jgi:hypothetical protein
VAPEPTALSGSHIIKPPALPEVMTREVSAAVPFWDNAIWFAVSGCRERSIKKAGAAHPAFPWSFCFIYLIPKLPIL